jgi:hypothetical protein
MGVERSAEVEATVDQHAWDAGQASGVAQQRAVLQPDAVREVVRGDPDERQQGVQWPVAVGVGLPVRLQ